MWRSLHGLVDMELTVMLPLLPGTFAVKCVVRRLGVGKSIVEGTKPR